MKRRWKSKHGRDEPREPSMTFDKARRVKMPFGKFTGKTLDNIAESDDGLLYLDWLAGQNTYGEISLGLVVYLGDAAIRADVEKLREARE